ncbi:hydrolase TatD [Rudanella paleaurantiibacter]|uniref:Hydrolase TatD n=1 Tax=Rudanella paleaurantiibacter TaxID=2614655 RepID=A0A7J5TYY6_9BACT|nr:TatD family hydrolase [Rudanella paleaurantiibacter]KAB7730334.1 hydrolase TatD [Rudanella paleaurantiibacter]
MIFIDTHAHIYDKQFGAERYPGGPEGMLQTARSQQVEQIWMPNCDSETIPGMMALAQAFPERCLPMMGLHPTYVNETMDTELAEMEKQLNSYPFMAVGEIGLDFYWDMTHVDRQFEAFRIQLGWASAQNRFVSMHTRSGHDRNAFAEAADLIESLALPNLTGIFHCFVGTLDEARRAIDLGFLLGIGGVATFKNGGLDKVLPYIGPEHIVLETDSPYLAPIPYRGKRNEPAYIPLVAARVAELMNLPLTEIARHTTANANRLRQPSQASINATSEATSDR